MGAGRRIQARDFDHPVHVMAARGDTVLILEESGVEVAVSVWPLDGGEDRDLGRFDGTYTSLTGRPRARAVSSSMVTWSGREVWMHDLGDLDGGPRLIGSRDLPIGYATFNHDGTVVATTDETGIIELWPAATPGTGPDRVLSGPGRSPEIRFDVTGDRLVAPDFAAGLAWVWDLSGPPDATPWIVGRRDTMQVSRASFDPSGHWLATSEVPAAITLWPLDRPFSQVLSAALGKVWDVEFFPDGSRLATACDDGTVRVWPLSPSAGDAHHVIFDAPVTQLTDLDIDPNQVVVLSSGANVSLIPLGGDDVQALPGFTLGAFCTTFSPDGRLAAAAGGHSDPSERVVRVWDLESGDVVVLGPVEREASESSGTSITHSAAAQDGSGDFIRMSFSPDGRQIVTSGWSGIRIWNLADGVSKYLGEGVDTVMASDGRTLYATASNLRTYGWAGAYDLRSGELRQFSSHEHAVVVALTPDGSTLVTGGYDGVVRVGSVDGGPTHLLYGHQGGVLGVAVSPDGRWIGSGDDHGELRLWPMPDLSKPPLHTLPREELIAKLKSLTNLRAVRDEASSTGWSIEVGPFPGWETVPSW